MSVRLVVALGAGIFALASVFRDKKKKIFFSYYYAGDRHYKRLMEAWSKNKRFSIEFDDVSSDVSINSRDKSYLRRKISKSIRECDVFVVLVGSGTHKSEWVSWEICKAVEYKKRVIAIKEKRNYRSPKELKSIGATWVYGYKEKDISRAIDEE